LAKSAGERSSSWDQGSGLVSPALKILAFQEAPQTNVRINARRSIHEVIHITYFVS
jgi:hypothetical protein